VSPSENRTSRPEGPFDATCRGCRVLMLPDPYHPPSLAAKQLIGLTVTCPVPGNLLGPKGVI
jgi:hypothetical protein